MKKFSVMLAMLIFAFNAMAAPNDKAATKKIAPVFDPTCYLMPPAPDVSVKKAELKVEKKFFKTWNKETDLVDPGGIASKTAAAVNKKAKDVADDSSPDPDGVHGKVPKIKVAANKKAIKEKSNTADDSSPGTNDAIDAENNFDKEVPAVIQLKK